MGLGLELESWSRYRVFSAVSPELSRVRVEEVEEKIGVIDVSTDGYLYARVIKG